MTKHPLGEEPFPKVQRELHLAQYQPVPSGPILGHLREEISSSSSPVPLEEGAGEEDTLSLLFSGWRSQVTSAAPPVLPWRPSIILVSHPLWTQSKTFIFFFY